MRLSIRIGAAAALIILTLVLVNRNMKTKGESIQDIWHFDTGSFRTSIRTKPKQDPGSQRKWRIASDNKPALLYQTTDITVPNQGVIVMGKRKEEDTVWVAAELAE
jgi:hypothetical protein